MSAPLGWLGILVMIAGAIGVGLWWGLILWICHADKISARRAESKTEAK